MKIIDILNKIANGEEVKFKIIDEQEDYYCKKDDFLRQDRNNQEVDWWLDSLWLNKEVEIIEETPIISKLYINNELQYDLEENKIPERLGDYSLDKKGKYPIKTTIYEEILKDKINELIDYLKSKGDE